MQFVEHLKLSVWLRDAFRCQNGYRSSTVVKTKHGPIRDAPSGRDTAWGVFVAINILQNITCTNMSVDE